MRTVATTGVSCCAPIRRRSNRSNIAAALCVFTAVFVLFFYLFLCACFILCAYCCFQVMTPGHQAAQTS